MKMQSVGNWTRNGTMSICILIGACAAGYPESSDKQAGVQVGGSPRNDVTETKSDGDDEKAMEAARKHALEHQTEIPLPNFASGAGLPRPLGFNFYRSSSEYPGYLMCTYDIHERHYDSDNEPAWFKAALLQIRAYGDDSFPPFKWVAVMIANRAEQRGASTFEKSCKVAAIFDIKKVFDRSTDLERLIAGSQLDRHPFKYDPQRPTPGKQQRWLIVERHMDKLRGPAKSKK